jgi:tetratricopeptide (TPR) repeat protein
LKLFLTLTLFFISLPCLAAGTDCLNKSKEYFNEKEYALAQDSLQACLKTAPTNTDILISLGGVQMILGKFAEAEKTFKKTLALINTKKSPYTAYINSRLGDISMRKPNLKEAAQYYDVALKVEPANINALVGKGICEENQGNIPAAVDLYNRALAVDFTNIAARDRLIALEPGILTHDEILLNMKERNLIDPAATDYTPEDEAFLKKMYVAERSKGIEYLSQKYSGKIPPGFIVERDSGKVYVRKMLTLTGYNELITQLSGDAKDFFLSKNILPGDIFKLKDYDNKPLFNERGELTEEGLRAYTRALRGYKSYLLPGERTPAGQAELEALIKKILASGYSEITIPEYFYLMRYSRCSEETLIKEFRMRVVHIDSRNRRVFVLSNPKIPWNLRVPYQTIVEYRDARGEGKKDIDNLDASTKFFGIGGNVGQKICKEDGTLETLGL